jgi:hypothetical protein
VHDVVDRGGEPLGVVREQASGGDPDPRGSAVPVPLAGADRPAAFEQLLDEGGFLGVYGAPQTAAT